MQALFYAVAQKLRNDLRGQDLIEYALIAGFVAVAMGMIFPTTLVPTMMSIFSKVDSTLGSASNSGS